MLYTPVVFVFNNNNNNMQLGLIAGCMFVKQGITYRQYIEILQHARLMYIEVFNLYIGQIMYTSKYVVINNQMVQHFTHFFIPYFMISFTQIGQPLLHA